MKRARLAITLILLALLAIFTLQNWEAVEIRFLVWQIETPRALLVGLLVLAGFALGLAFRVSLPQIARSN